MMNDTVARIVDLMFDNAEMNEEVAALRDEVMNNCQDRYRDLVSSGVPEDDAVAAVVESLKGMEDVIAQYSRKTRRTQETPCHQYTTPEETDMEYEGGERDLVVNAQEIHAVDLALISEDVSLEPSDDGMYHVCWDADESPRVAVMAVNGTLKIERTPDNGAADTRRMKKVRVDAREGMKNARVCVDGKVVSGADAETTMENVGSMMENLGRALGRMFRSVSSGFGGDTTVTIRIPIRAVPHVKLVTTSGDIDIDGVELAELNVTTVSGDVTVDLPEDAAMKLINLRSTSGDVEATVCAQGLTVSSISGDVDVEGRIDQLAVNTVSGDIDVCAEVKNVTFKAISGDVDFDFESDEIREIRGSTVSGDIDVNLPVGIGAIAINTHTRSGDVTTRYSTNGFGPTVSGEISTMSGDITIR